MSVTQADHDRVWFVQFTLRDGTTEELAFPNKTLAEVFLADLPHSDIGAVRAILRPSGIGYN